uniref:Uncharacterized protein n=1 Tax=Anguilla anguilla TaxID=7936 RepID=A0A0E9U103_ANGAN
MLRQKNKRNKVHQLILKCDFLCWDMYVSV